MAAAAAPRQAAATPWPGSRWRTSSSSTTGREYDAPSTFKKFKAAHPGTPGQRDLLLVQRRAARQALRRRHRLRHHRSQPERRRPADRPQNSLMALDQTLLPNLKNLDPTFLKPSYDPTGQFHVIKDYGITMFFFMNNVVTDHPKTMLDFYKLLPKYVSKGRTNVLDGAEEVVPLALMALGLDPNTDKDCGLLEGQEVPARHPQGRDDDRLVGLHQRRHRRQDHPRPGLERRRAPHRSGPQEAGRHHPGHPDGDVGGLGRQLVHPGQGAASRSPPTPGSTGCSSRPRRSPR